MSGRAIFEVGDDTVVHTVWFVGGTVITGGTATVKTATELVTEIPVIFVTITV